MQPFGHKGRLEDERMLKGRGRYVADWNLPGQAYGHFVRRRHHRLRDERRAPASRERLPGARGDPRLGRQRQREMAAAHQGRRPAVAPAQRDRALYRSNARRQVAAVYKIVGALKRTEDEDYYDRETNFSPFVLKG